MYVGACVSLLTLSNLIEDAVSFAVLGLEGFCLFRCCHTGSFLPFSLCSALRGGSFLSFSLLFTFTFALSFTFVFLACLLKYSWCSGARLDSCLAGVRVDLLASVLVPPLVLDVVVEDANEVVVAFLFLLCCLLLGFMSSELRLVERDLGSQLL